MARIISCHLSTDKASSFTLMIEPTPYSPTALCSFSGLIRMDWSFPSVIMPISSCVIWPIFSLSVICPSSFSTAAADALAGGPAGVILRCKKVWLSTIPEAALSAPEGTAMTVQTASKITICQCFVFGVFKGFSLPSILPRGGSIIQILAIEKSDCSIRDNCCLAASSGNWNADLNAAKNIGNVGWAAAAPSVLACCTPVGSSDDPYQRDSLSPRDTDTAAANAAAAALP